ncbi:hypothetical protein BDZ89DRAFT_1131632 [Hymenopellis radicata]|nr:hypothetical protein BDZ89DRAFT_1131632 [Hymenopellis radicata]
MPYRGLLSKTIQWMYADAQTEVKNIFITLAKLALDDPNFVYNIILEGTDHLEGLLSNMRTQDHNRNFDSLQLAQKLV